MKKHEIEFGGSVFGLLGFAMVGVGLAVCWTPWALVSVGLLLVLIAMVVG